MTEGPPVQAEPLPEPRRPWALLDVLAGFSWRFLVCVAALAVVVFVLVELSFIVIPLLIAVLISSITSPIALWLQRHGWRKGTAATATVALVLLLLVLIALVVIPPLVQNLKGFTDALAKGIEELDKTLQKPPFNMPADQADDVAAQLKAYGPELEKTLKSGVGTLVPLVAQGIATFFLAVVMTGYMLVDGDRYWRWMIGFVDEPRRPAIDALGRNAYATLSAYMRGTAIVASFNTVAITFGFWLIGMPLLVPLAILIFVAAFLPIIGAWLAAGTAVLVALASIGVTAAIEVGLVYLVVSQFKSYFISPYVVGSRVKLAPIVTLTGVMVGTVLAGIAGGILAIPIIASVSGALGQVRRWRTEGTFDVVPSADAG